MNILVGLRRESPSSSQWTELVHSHSVVTEYSASLKSLLVGAII
jgi:hypothetical protein